MSFQVLWVPAAERELAAIWTVASDRRSVTDAANKIDLMLRSNPEVGESRDEDRRVLLESPLGVIFRVEPQDRTRFVLTVWCFEGR